ncbi:MAG: preprotein translocase subunit SecD [Patescibacteria group bacterium]
MNPQYFEGGVLIKDVEVNSSAAMAGIAKGQILYSINGNKIEALADYSLALENLEERVEIATSEQEYVFILDGELGLTIEEIPLTRIKMGLDLQGGARALVKPERTLTTQEMNDLKDTVSRRLNVYGITDIEVRDVRDISGEQYLLVQLAGVTPKDLEELIGQQGKFEAKIGNEVAFVGGNNDLTYVCRNDATCERIEYPCFETDTGYGCKFTFEIHLSEEAAKRHAAITANLEENISAGNSYLNETLDLYLDDVLVDQLLIGAELKGMETTRVSISGSGVGATNLEAVEDSRENMKKLQTILKTGSLPFKLKIEKLDSISPLLGQEFIKNILWAGLIAIIAVCLIIYLRYRRMKLFIPVVVTLVSELILILGVAAIIKWNIDLPAIAGILAAIGTGVDDQIVMIDESRVSKQYSIKERIKRAFFIIMGAYVTVVVSLLPLMWAGAGLLVGFAVTTLIGVTIGVLITRPAFSEILKRITKD